MPRRIQQCPFCDRRFITTKSLPQETSEIFLCPSCASQKQQLLNSADSSKMEPPKHDEKMPSEEQEFAKLKETAIDKNQEIHSENVPVESQRDIGSAAGSPKNVEIISLLDDDEEEIDDADDQGSEAGDDVHCTQIILDDDDDDDILSSDEEDEELNLTELVTKKRMSLELVPVVSGDQLGEKPQETALKSSPSSTTFNDADTPIKVELQGQSHANEPNEDLRTCSICGASLLHIASWKGRVNHVKRCSKTNGVSERDIRARLEEEDDLLIDQSRPTPSPKKDSSPSFVRNPYSQPTKSMSNQKSEPKSSLPNSTNKSASVFDMLMAGAKRVAQAARVKKPASPIATDGKQQSQQEPRAVAGKKRSYDQRFQQPRDPSKIRPCPFYKKISGTDFVVDGFQYAKKSLTENYFLTHFHSDHYGGINKHWDAGIIYCSEPTANLVHSQLGVDRKYLHTLPMDKPVTISTRGNKDVVVTLLNANHCPGAVLFLFQVGNKHILHVGDFRWNRATMLPQLQSIRIEELYLDTTYCNPKYKLPSQAEAIAATVEFAKRQVKQAISANQSILLLFGAYTIGKERIYLAVAEHLNLRVYVDRRRYRILSQLGWSHQTMNLLTTNPEEAILWVVPLGHCGMKKLPSYLEVKIGKFAKKWDRVVGFRPTGWSMTTKQTAIGGGHGGIIKHTTRGKVTSVGIPYSEHSSFPELVDAVECLKPRKIIPTVSVGKSKEQVALLLKHCSSS